jgi:hypothetical protein
VLYDARRDDLFLWEPHVSRGLLVQMQGRKRPVGPLTEDVHTFTSDTWGRVNNSVLDPLTPLRPALPPSTMIAGPGEDALSVWGLTGLLEGHHRG